MRRTYLVRHAKAESRSQFVGEDDLRPLDETGLIQARSLPDLLEVHGAPGRLLSSPARRCLGTLEPLSVLSGIVIEEAAWLAEGSDPIRAVEHLRLLEEERVAACTHGDVVWGILEWIARGGVEIGRRPDAAKASTWVLDWPDGSAEGVPVRATYLPPPG